MNNVNEFYASILNNVRADAKAEERQRIIDLLQEKANECDFEQMGGAHSNHACECWYLRAIKLIQEENK